MAVSKVSKLVEEEKLFRFDQRITSSRCCKYLNICIYLQNVLQKMFYVSYRMNFCTQYFSGISFLCIFRYILIVNVSNSYKKKIDI